MNDINNFPDMVDVTGLTPTATNALRLLLRMVDETQVRDFDEGMMDFSLLCYITSSITLAYKMADSNDEIMSHMKDLMDKVGAEMTDLFGDSVDDIAGDFLKALNPASQVRSDMILHKELQEAINQHLNKVREDLLEKYK